MSAGTSAWVPQVRWWTGGLAACLATGCLLPSPQGSCGDARVGWGPLTRAACEQHSMFQLQPRCRKLHGQQRAGVLGQLRAALPRNHPVCGQVSAWHAACGFVFSHAIFAVCRCGGRRLSGTRPCRALDCSGDSGTAASISTPPRWPTCPHSHPSEQVFPEQGKHGLQRLLSPAQRGGECGGSVWPAAPHSPDAPVWVPSPPPMRVSIAQLTFVLPGRCPQDIVSEARGEKE